MENLPMDIIRSFIEREEFIKWRFFCFLKEVYDEMGCDLVLDIGYFENFMVR